MNNHVLTYKDYTSMDIDLDGFIGDEGEPRLCAGRDERMRVREIKGS